VDTNFLTQRSQRDLSAWHVIVQVDSLGTLNISTTAETFSFALRATRVSYYISRRLRAVLCRREDVRQSRESVASCQSVGPSWSVAASGSIRSTDETHETDKKYSWSDFSSSTDKSDWDALNLCITKSRFSRLPWLRLPSMITDANTAISEVPIGRDVIAVVSGRAVIDESDEET